MGPRDIYLAFGNRYTTATHSMGGANCFCVPFSLPKAKLEKIAFNSFSFLFLGTTQKAYTVINIRLPTKCHVYDMDKRVKGMSHINRHYDSITITRFVFRKVDTLVSVEVSCRCHS